MANNGGPKEHVEFMKDRNGNDCTLRGGVVVGGLHKHQRGGMIMLTMAETVKGDMRTSTI